jgi:dipeptidyl aminopeptidase/acylaminoacyl peptidase
MQDNKVNQFSDPAYSRMLVKLGDPKRDAEKFDAISPLRHADQIRAALLISNSEYDPSAQVSDTKDLGSTVERNHVPVEMVSFLNEAHGVRHLRAKVELYSRIEAFLSKNLAGGPPQ